MAVQYFVGLDLAAKHLRPTGVCILTSQGLCLTWMAYGDGEILDTVRYFRPLCVAVDAPLSWPKGGRTRRCERMLWGMGLRPLPQSLGPMRALTRRAIRLSTTLKRYGAAIVETFPDGVRKVLNLVSGVAGLRRLGLVIPAEISEHELDAALCGLVAFLSWRGYTVAYGDPGEGVIVLPKPPLGEMF